MTRRALLAQLATPLLPLPKPLRLGLIGLDGHVAEITGPLDRLPQVKLVAVTSGDDRPLPRNPHLQAAKRYPTEAALLDAGNLDVVGICNNDGDRAGTILACIDRNIPFIAEKPFAIQRSAYNRIKAGVTRGHLSCSMLLPMRFEPAYRAMHDFVASGEVGEILQIDAQKSYVLGDRPAWQKHQASYGSTILWIGIHMIDLMRWTTGRELRRVASLQSRVGFPAVGDMETVTASIFQLDNNGTGTLRMDYLRPAAAGSHGDDRLRVAGTRGILEHRAGGPVTLLSNKGPARELSSLPPPGSVFVDFLGAAFLHQQPALPLSDIWRANEITLAADEAARSGGFVST